jgi:hypothetical protein
MSSCIKLKFDPAAYEAALADSMWVYIWEDMDEPGYCKFGERWVFAGQNPVKECQQRAYESQAVRKDRAKDGKIVLVAIFDVTVIAKSTGRYYMKSRVDDMLREFIGYRKGSTGEMHRLSAQDMKGRVATLIHSYGQSLMPAVLSTKQYEIAGEILESFDSGNQVILANLCARFGKTIWSGAVSLEANAKLTIVASYVKTVFTSFGNDLKMFEQFADVVHVDTGDDDYRAQITKARRQGKKVFAYLSLCNGSKRQSRINFLFKVPGKKMLVIDEADFGAHKKNQADVLLKKVNKDPKVKVIIMTGTNGDRAITYWSIDDAINVTYPELLIQKHADDWDRKLYYLDHFSLSYERDLLVPDFACYQMDLSGLVQAAIDAGECGKEFILLPSWSKFGAYPVKSKGFFTRTLQAVFLGQGNHDELNIDFQAGFNPKPRVAMMFVSAHNHQMDQIDSIANEALSGYIVITLSGARKYFGKKITQRNCQKIVSEVVEVAQKEGKPVLIITNIMAQRSFSIPEITELYLAYDKGEIGSTIQKMSRTLTPGDVDKSAKIVSLSFDANRDDKFDAMILETAVEYKKRNKMNSTADALRTVLSTIDIFACKPDGAVLINKDTYLEEAMARDSLSRVLGKSVHIELADDDIITALAEGNSDYIRAVRQEITQHGKRGIQLKNRGPNIMRDFTAQKKLAKAREVIVTILENLGDLIEYAGTPNMVDAFKVIEKDKLAQRGINDDFGVSHEVVAYLFESGIISQTHVELMYDV